MNRTRKPPARKGVKKAAGQTNGSHPRAIVLVDEEPLRAAALQEHQLLEEKAAELRARLDRFENSELPSYTRWEAAALGPFLTEIRETEQAISQKRSILEAIEDEIFFTNCTRLAAYRRVMHRVETNQDPSGMDEDLEDEPAGSASPGEESEQGSGERMFGESDLPPGFEAEDFDRMTSAQKRDFREQYQVMAEMYEMLTGKIAPKLDDLLRASRQKDRREGAQHKSGPEPHARRPEPAAPPRKSSRLKELYRLLVRKLHPDHNPDQTARDRELWHAVQKAYQSGDVESLEAAIARAEFSVAGKAGKFPISILRRMVFDLRNALRALRGKLAAARKHPAWDFSPKSAVLAKMEAKQRKNLQRHLTSLKSYLAALSADLDSLAARAAQPKRPRPRPRPPRAAPPKKRSVWEEESFFF